MKTLNFGHKQNKINSFEKVFKSPQYPQKIGK